MKQPPAAGPARILALGLALAGCGDPAIVTLAPTLACAERIHCDMVEWQIGFRHGPKLSGGHVTCQCSAIKK